MKTIKLPEKLKPEPNEKVFRRTRIIDLINEIREPDEDDCCHGCGTQLPEGWEGLRFCPECE